MIDHHAVLFKVAKPASFEIPPLPPETYNEALPREQIGIADVREIIEKANRTPPGEAKSQTLIVITDFITLEAQQALLKIIEEPPQSTSFIFVVPASMTMLPTLLSRFSVSTAEDTTCESASFEEFKAMSIAKRMEVIEKATKNKNLVWQGDIKCGLIEHLQKESRKHDRDELEALHYVATTLLTRGASNKFLLEQLALSL